MGSNGADGAGADGAGADGVGANGSDGSARRAGGRVPHPPSRAFVAVGVSGAFFAGLSLAAVSLAVRLTGVTVSGGLPLVLIAAGSLTVAAAGGWFVQPVVTRLLAVAVRVSKKATQRRYRADGR